MAIAGIVIAAIILIAGAFWTGKSASEDTEKAVRNVSLLYLNELAERREQVVAARLADTITTLQGTQGKERTLWIVFRFSSFTSAITTRRPLQGKVRRL